MPAAADQFRPIGQSDFSISDPGATENEHTTLNVQNLRTPLVQADDDEDYADEME